LFEGERTIGAGLSPGDATVNEPYFYVTLWPCPNVNELPGLRIGHWNTQGWTGAVLIAEELLTHADQGTLVNQFLRQAVDLLRSKSE
jgi:hypothetical protein